MPIFFSAARNIDITDKYDRNSFDPVEPELSMEGMFIRRIKEIPAGHSEKFFVTLIPKFNGIYDSTRALVHYDTIPDSEDGFAVRKTGYSSTSSRLSVSSFTDYQARHKTFYVSLNE